MLSTCIAREMGPHLYSWAQEISAEGAVTMWEIGADQGATEIQ